MVFHDEFSLLIYWKILFIKTVIYEHLFIQITGYDELRYFKCNTFFDSANNSRKLSTLDKTSRLKKKLFL